MLLGVPWLFSAFGVIDAKGNAEMEMLEGVWQVTLFKSKDLLSFVKLILCFWFTVDTVRAVCTSARCTHLRVSLRAQQQDSRSRDVNADVTVAASKQLFV